MSEAPILACPPKDERWFKAMGVTTFKPPEGSVEMPCVKCGKTCFVGPKQQQVIAGSGGQVWCFLCLIKTYGAESISMVQSLGGKGGTYERASQN